MKSHSLAYTLLALVPLACGAPDGSAPEGVQTDTVEQAIGENSCTNPHNLDASIAINNAVPIKTLDAPSDYGHSTCPGAFIVSVSMHNSGDGGVFASIYDGPHAGSAAFPCNGEFARQVVWFDNTGEDPATGLRQIPNKPAALLKISDITVIGTGGTSCAPLAVSYIPIAPAGNRLKGEFLVASEAGYATAKEPVTFQASVF